MDWKTREKAMKRYFSEMLAGIAAVAWVLDGGEHLKTFGETTGIVDFIWISGHSGNLNIPDGAYKSVRNQYAAISLMEGLCHHSPRILVDNFISGI